jgi:hypothetical protein
MQHNYTKNSFHQGKTYKELIKMKSATGKLTDDEMEKFGIEKVKEPEVIVEDIVKRIKKGEITDKFTAWNELKELNIPDAQKVRLLNFYLNLFDMGSFNKVFKNKKEKLSNLALKLKKKD